MAFSMSCPTFCGDLEVPVMPSTCIIEERQMIISRLMIIPCDAMLPDPVKGAIKPLFDDGTIGMTGELSTWTPSDPTYVERRISNCAPSAQFVSTREFVFEDRRGLTFEGGSPYEVDKYAEYDFYQWLLANYNNVYIGRVLCNGDAFFPKINHSDVLTKASLTGFSTEELWNEESGISTEVKRFTLRYQGDPFSFNKPDFNLYDEGIW